jgi:ATP-dependent helicase/nuclease subunit A
VKTLKNIAISASAGSGKTFNLTNRFIYLLHHFEAPERIVALTFTRNAAGEFFQKIIDKLRVAASDSRQAESLSRSIGIDADSARYLELLRLLIGRMHRLNLQTLDSFFYRLVAAFSLELGLSGSIQLLDESAEPRVRKSVRDRIVHRPGKMDTEMEAFWQAFKQATYGQEKRSVDKTVSDFIEVLYPLYLEAPDAQQWGRAATIWRGACPWQTEKPDWSALADRVEATAPKKLVAQNSFETTLQDIRNYPEAETLHTFLIRALEEAPNLLNGAAVIKSGRSEFAFERAAADALAAVIKAIVWHHLQRALENTAGVYKILNEYHTSYDRIVRRPGKLCFSDLTHLLNPEAPHSPLHQIDALSRQMLDFRLDGQFDHWLVDEFQDTSRPQWQVIANLIDEIIQDSSGERSFYYVGDTKQCLYLWRNSDDRLFHEIATHYQPLIEQQTLAMSWRSAPAILDAVNEVFEDRALIEAHFGTDVANRWARAWAPHEASPETERLSGYACWRETVADESGRSRNEQILAQLEALQPNKRGMTVGVLVRKNELANEIVDYIRAHSELSVHNGSAVQPASDNLAGVALIQLIQLAAHPGDRLARGYLQMIPEVTGGAPLADQAESIRRHLLSEGCEAGVRRAADHLRTYLPADDRRHRERLNMLVETARHYESEQESDLDGLLEQLRNAYRAETSPGDAIIVETVHKSKGLEYDVVLLVEESNRSRSDRSIRAHRDGSGQVEWILEPLRKDLMQADPQLAALHDASENQSGFDTLCNLYVAMTRAKRALYIFSQPKGASQGTAVKYLSERLGMDPDEDGIFWEIGDRRWDASFEPKTERRDAAPMGAPPTFQAAHPRLQLARPSSGKESQLSIGQFFDLEANAVQFGTRMHDAFEKIEWLEDDRGPAFESKGAPESDEARITQTLNACFANPELRALFSKPTGEVELWREKAFSYVEGDQFANGVFDRVHLIRGDEGSALRATIIDFKTDRIHEENTLEQASEKHRPQLEAYAKALSKIVGLDLASIELKLVFTDQACVVSMTDTEWSEVPPSLRGKRTMRVGE